MSGWKYAFSLSKDAVNESTPPGTVVVNDNNARKLHHVDATQDDNTETRIRYPQPSDDPADPLNWALWRKHAMLFVVSIFAFVANFTSADIAPGFTLWPMVYPQDPRSFGALSRLMAVNVLMMGLGSILWVPLSTIVGRRPVLITATLLLTLSTMWGGLTKGYDSLLAARIFQGIGIAAADTVAPTLVGEVYFLHERGRAMAAYTICLVAGPIVGGLAGGYIAYDLGWHYVFWVGTALSAACFVGTILLVPETLYRRKLPASAAVATDDADGEKGDVTELELQISTTTPPPLLPQQPPVTLHRPFTFARSLGFRRPSTGGESVLWHFVQPWHTLALPGTWVVMLHYGGLVGGIVTVSTTGPQLMAQPPYLWGTNAGLINVGALVGSLLGAAYTYVVADAQVRGAAARSKGSSRGGGALGGYRLVEPESRLPSMFPALVVATGGFVVFGFCAQNPGPRVWIGLQFGYGMISFGLMQVPSIGFNYLIDSYSYLAGDCFVMVTVLRAIISFAWTFFVADWIEERGAAEAFAIFGMLMGLFGLLTVPLWLLGKRMRIATAHIVG